MSRNLLLYGALLFSVFATAAVAADDWDTCNNYEQPQKAMKACTAMIRAGQYKPMYHVYAARGIAYWWLKRYDSAIADFDQCLRLEPKDSICFGQRGMVHKLKGNRAQALTDLQTAVALDPNNQTAVHELEKLRSGN